MTKTPLHRGSTVAERASDAADRFEIVFVCTGNRFRSPLAAALVRSLTDGLPVAADSAGTLDVGPLPPLPVALEVGMELGVDLSAHRARALAAEQVEGADLVLGFERFHVATAVVECGAAAGRAFTLPELVELLGAIARPTGPGVAGRARAIVSAADEARRTGPRSPLVPELDDPLGKPRRRAREIGLRLRGLTEELVAGLFDASVSAAAASIRPRARDA